MVLKSQDGLVWTCAALIAVVLISGGCAAANTPTSAPDGEAQVGLPSCAETVPIVGDWCLLGGEAPAGGWVTIEGGAAQIRFRAVGDFSIPVAIDGETPELIVTIAGPDGATESATYRPTRASNNGERDITGRVTGPDDASVVGATVRIGDQTSTTGSDGTFVVRGLSTAADLVHVSADGYLPRIDSLAMLSGAGADANATDRGGPVIELTPLGAEVPILAGTRTVRLADGVEIDFGPGGAPRHDQIRYTPAPQFGTVGGAFGIVLFDLSPLDLGDGAVLRLSSQGGGDVVQPADEASPLPPPDLADTLRLVDPYTMTARSRPVSVGGSGDMTTVEIDLDEIRGEGLLWGALELGEPSISNFRSDLVRLEVPDRIKPCAAIIETFRTEYLARARVDPGPAGGMSAAFLSIVDWFDGTRIAGESTRAIVSVGLQPGEFLVPPLYMERFLRTETYEIWGPPPALTFSPLRSLAPSFIRNQYWGSISVDVMYRARVSGEEPGSDHLTHWRDCPSKNGQDATDPTAGNRTAGTLQCGLVEGDLLTIGLRNPSWQLQTTAPPGWNWTLQTPPECADPLEVSVVLHNGERLSDDSTSELDDDRVIHVRFLHYQFDQSLEDEALRSNEIFRDGCEESQITWIIGVTCEIGSDVWTADGALTTAYWLKDDHVIGGDDCSGGPRGRNRGFLANGVVRMPGDSATAALTFSLITFARYWRGHECHPLPPVLDPSVFDEDVTVALELMRNFRLVPRDSN